MFCKNCGKEIKDTAKFCPYCGSPCEAVNTAKTDNTGNAIQPKNPKIAVIGIAAIIVIIILVVIHAFSLKPQRNGFKDKEEPEEYYGNFADVTFPRYCAVHINRDNYLVLYNEDPKANTMNDMYDTAGFQIKCEPNTQWSEASFKAEKGGVDNTLNVKGRVKRIHLSLGFPAYCKHVRTKSRTNYLTDVYSIRFLNTDQNYVYTCKMFEPVHEKYSYYDDFLRIINKMKYKEME